MTTTQRVQTYPIYSQESNWELWPQREYALLNEKEIQDLPDEYSSMWSLNYWTREQVIHNLQHLAEQGNWTAENVIEQLSK